MIEKRWEIEIHESPIIAIAIHNGHDVRKEVENLFEISDQDRLREEDPYTGEWAKIGHNSLIQNISRFEIDMNRPRNTAIYRRPEDAWGLKIWRHEPPKELLERSLEEYDRFYRDFEDLLTKVIERSGRFIVLDLHSYNHHRKGPNHPPDDPKKNPDVNIGTGSMDRKYWEGVVDRLIRDLSGFDFEGKALDVRENVKFKGAQISGFVHEKFPNRGCSISIEIKKNFMDEWTGELNLERHLLIKKMIQSAVPGILEELNKLG